MQDARAITSAKLVAGLILTTGLMSPLAAAQTTLNLSKDLVASSTASVGNNLTVTYALTFGTSFLDSKSIS